MKEFAVNVKCVNGRAERAIKLISDRLDTVKDERDVHDLMQSIEYHREMYPRLSNKLLV